MYVEENSLGEEVKMYADNVPTCDNCALSQGVGETEEEKKRELYSVIEEKTDAEINIIPASNFTIVPVLTKASADDQFVLSIKQTPTVSNAPAVTWETSDLKKAQIDPDGTVHTFAKGSVTFTATTSDNVNKAKKATMTVELVDAPATVTLDHDKVEVQAGKTTSLKATVKPSSADQDVVWSSSDETKATVSGGTVSAQPEQEGEVIITAKALVGHASAQCVVTITPAHEFNGPLSEPEVKKAAPKSAPKSAPKKTEGK